MPQENSEYLQTENTANESPETIASLNIVGLVSAFIAGKVFAPKVDHPKADS